MSAWAISITDSCTPVALPAALQVVTNGPNAVCDMTHHQPIVDAADTPPFAVLVLKLDWDRP